VRRRQSAVDGLDATRFAIADAHVVDHGVESAKSIGLFCDLACSGKADDIAFDDGLGLRQCTPSDFGARRVSRMQDDLVALFDQQLAGHEPEALGRPGDEDSGHDGTSW